jgi:iron(III) transport system ATP-binding protein
LRTEFGFLKAVVWNTGVSQSWERGDAVVLRVPESALLVERT